ncbi:stalk domain-containing protein [Turicibacter sp. H121]|uniref:stalk domain-containing protein n=1 Tax=Turicibacter sp. H121 TaxID=1712675 RepID=UPI0021D495C8|nr:stalk domain-containing protein [Turicibacter sp. H121]MCU7198382.1 stalk domain-containing protein [Turicibacter sp. H121]
MKYPIIFLFSLLPAFLTSNQETLKPINIPVDIHEDFASLDDIMATLEGSVTLDEETDTYTYRIQGQEIKLNLNYGYSEVNGENEALFIEIDKETNLMTIKWVTPQLIDDEIYVPIQYIERVLDATYTDHAFTVQVKETVVEEEESDEEELIREVNPEDEQEIPKPLNTSKPNQIEQKPTPPIQTEDKQPSDEPTQTPIQPESKPEDKPEDKPVPPVEDDKGDSEDPQPPVDEEENLPPLPAINQPDNSKEEDEADWEHSNDDLSLSNSDPQSDDTRD